MAVRQIVESSTSSALRVALACLCAGGVIVTVAAEYVGAGIETANGETTVRAASSPKTIIWSLVALSALTIFLRLARRSIPGPPLKWFRRVIACALDIVVYSTSVGGLFALVPLVVEAKRVGQFHWSFSRSFLVWQDWFSIGVPTFAILLSFVVYLAWPIVHERQTVGGYIMRVGFVRNGQSSRSFGRSIVVVALCYVVDLWASFFGWSLLERVGYKAVKVR
jgi:hypothetical protein